MRTEAIRVLCAGHYGADEVLRWAASPMPPRFGEVLEHQRALVVDEGEPAAFGFLDRDDRQLAALYVRPAAAHRGLGRALLAALEGDARREGLSMLELSSSLNAVAFYRSGGWSEVSRGIFRHPEGFDLPSVRMVKRLGREDP